MQILMKSIFTGLGFGLAFWCAGFVLRVPEAGVLTQNRSSRPTPTISGPSFPLGEKCTYLVSWKVFDAGIATIDLVDRYHAQNEELYRIRATVRSTGIVATLFTVFDTFESNIAVASLCSRGISKNIHEGRRQRNTVLEFDQKGQQARMVDTDLSHPGLPPKHSESPIPPCVQDVISAFYFVRTKDLKVDETFRFPINDGGKTYDVDVEVQAVETVKTPAGTFQAYRLEPKVFGGLFKNKGRLFVWLTNDTERIPVQLRARITVGTITASLSRIEKSPTIQASPKKSQN